MFDCSQFPRIVEAWHRLPKFWGDPESRYPGDSQILLDAVNGLPLCVEDSMLELHMISLQEDDKHSIHPGAMWEVCNYLSVPYPRKEVDEYIRRRVTNIFRDKIVDRDRYGSSRGYCIVVRHYENQVNRLEETVNKIIPYVMKAEMEKPSLRAVWGVLMLELRLAKARLAGVSRRSLEE